MSKRDTLKNYVRAEYFLEQIFKTKKLEIINLKEMLELDLLIYLSKENKENQEYN